jgi:hypothetical protein
VGAPLPQVHPEWVRRKLQDLERLLNQNPARAKLEVMKHLDGDLTVKPLPAPSGAKRAQIEGRVKPNSLLAGKDQEAAFATLVAGAGFEPATFGL